jgi:hypothetical protein
MGNMSSSAHARTPMPEHLCSSERIKQGHVPTSCGTPDRLRPPVCGAGRRRAAESVGQRTGRNGSTGNAAATAPHVHFEAHPGPESAERPPGTPRPPERPARVAANATVSLVMAGQLEPDPLRLGKAFGTTVAAGYPEGMAQGGAHPEVSVSIAGARRGRIDLLLDIDDSGKPLLVVMEVKNTDWDARAAHRVLPNLARHARQVWKYLDALMPRLDAGELAGLQAALVYPQRPSHPGRAAVIEQTLGDHGISVLFYDEL